MRISSKNRNKISKLDKRRDKELSINCNTVKASIKISKFNNYITWIALIISLSSLVTTYWMAKESYLFNEFNKELTIEKQVPKIIITQIKKKDKYELNLWNVGPGFAYDVVVDTYIERRYSSIGLKYSYDVIDASVKLRTKTKPALLTLSSLTVEAENPPPILPVGFDVNYKVSSLSWPILKEIDILIKYKDALGSNYFSFWDGLQWEFGKGHKKITYHHSKDKKHSNSMLKYYSSIVLNKNMSKAIKTPRKDESKIYLRYAELLNGEIENTYIKGYRNIYKSLIDLCDKEVHGYDGTEITIKKNGETLSPPESNYDEDMLELIKLKKMELEMAYEFAQKGQFMFYDIGK